MSDSEEQVFAESRGPSISPDGNIVAFFSAANDLVPEDNNSLSDVFVRDPSTGSTTLVSVGLGGLPADGASAAPSLSGDGRYVLFQSSATNLVTGDDNGVLDVFVYDRQTGVTELVSVSTSGAQGTAASFAGDISPDGRYIAFWSSSGFDPEPGGGVQIYLRDRTLSTTRFVSVRIDGLTPSATSSSPSVSDDGRYVAFSSPAPMLVTGDTNNLDDVFVRDMVDNVTTRVSVGPGGVQGTGVSKRGAISGDGRFVAFESTASNLVVGDSNGAIDLFRHERATGTTTRVSLGPAGEQGIGSSFARDHDGSSRFISRDGRYVVFRSSATNFGGPIGAFYLRDTVSGTTVVVSVTDIGSDDTGLNGVISANGRYVALESFSALVASDSNNVIDVYLRDTQPPFDFGSFKLGLLWDGAFSDDPVNLATGNFFHSAVDLAMPGRLLGTSFTRYYNSADLNSGPLGPGWTHSYNWTVADEGTTVDVRRGDGRVDRFTRNPDLSYSAPLGVFDTLVKNGDSTYTLTLSTQHAFAFSSAGRLTRISEPAGNQVNLSYTADNLTTITDAVARTITLSYDGSQLTQLQDPIGRKVTYGYDGAGRLTTVTDKIGNAAGQNPTEHQWHYAYDGNTRHITTITDPDGRVRVTNTYDTQGRVFEQRDGRMKLTTFTYNTLQTVETDPRGHTTTYSFDPSFRLLSESDVVSGVPRTVSFTYDGAGNRDSVTDRNGFTTNFTYDTRGNPLTKMDPQVDPSTPRYVTTFDYDSRNNLIELTDARNFVTTHTFDAVKNVKLSTTQQITAAPATYAITKWEFNDAANPGMPTKVTAPRGNTTPTPNYAFAQSLTYDSVGNLSQVIDADGRKTTFGYDSVGRQTTVVDPDGYAAGGVPADHIWTTVYDENDRVTQSIDPLGHAAVTSYDRSGNVAATTDRNGNVTSYVYDNNTRLESVTQKPDPIAQPALVYTTSVVRDDNGNAGRVMQANGVVTDYAYDELDRLTSFTTHPSQSVALTTIYELDGNGNTKKRTTGDGVETIYTYDALDRLKNVSSTGLPTPIAYTYDELSQRTIMSDGTGTSTYAYDGLGRITQAMQPNGTLGYGYDLDSNRTTLTYPTVGNVTYGYSPGSYLSTVTDWATRQSAYTYSAAGRVKTLTLPNGMTTTYTYDRAQRLTNLVNATASATISSHAYTLDAEGNRTALDEYVQGITQAVPTWSPSVQVNDVTTGQQDSPDIALGADGATYLIWHDFRAAGAIYSSRRDPASGIWGANQKVNDTNSGPANPSIALDASNNAYAVWQDRREGTNHNPDTNIYFSKRSAATGLWSANVRVNHDTSGRPNQIRPEIAVRSSGDAVAVWEDYRSNQWNVYSSRLAAGGSSWGTDLRITDNTVSRKFTPDVAVGADGTAYAVWEDDRSGNPDIWFSTLPAGSSTWTANVKISDDPGTTAQYDAQIGISAAGDLLVIWQDDRVPNTEVRLRRRLAGQSNWQASTVASDAASIPVSLALGVRSDGNAFAAWQDARGPSYNIWGADYTFATNTWSVPAMVSDDPATTAQMRPAAALSSTELAVAWRDDRVTGGDIRARRRGQAQGLDHFTLAYDGLNRLKSITGPVSETFAFDEASNITARTGPSQTNLYDEANRLTSDGTLNYTWSDADRLAMRNSDTFTYDALDRLMSSAIGGTNRTYAFNGDGLLQSRTQGTATPLLWDPSASVSPLLKLGADNIVYGHGPLYAVRPDASTVTFARDGSKNVRAEVSSAGGVTRAWRYRVYGDVAASLTGEQPAYFGLASQLRDPSGLYFMRARWYDPAVGRFLSRDALSGSAGNPVSLNSYSYAAADPIGLIDPTGFGAESSDLDDAVCTGVIPLPGKCFAPGRLADDYEGALLSTIRPIGGLGLQILFTKRPKADPPTVGGGGGGGGGASGLAELLRQLRKYGQEGYTKLENGRIRFYGPLDPAKKSGEMSGTRRVREWDPATGNKRTWFETLDATGTVRSVRPETGGVKVHFVFDASGKYVGRR